ncbi:MAG: hydrogenase maturation protease [Nitrospira sp.]|nr:hydrogenase maturation protease [Nitrospira sp.]
MAQTTVNDTTPSDSSLLRRPVGRSNIRIIGLGNEWRGDDAAGLLAARRLRDRLDRIGERGQVIEARQAGTDLLDLMNGARVVLLIDAAKSGQPAGTIHRLDASAGPIALNLACRSTHGVGVAETIELGRTLGRLPETVMIYGIEVAETGWGPSLSQPVEEAVEQVVEQIARDVEPLLCMNSM